MKTINLSKTLKGLVLVGAMLASTSAMAGGAETFKSCTACHGQHAEKHALGKSKVINEMSKEQIVTALHGYKDGSYGGPMKGVMKGQVMRLDDAQINSLAEYIPTLKK